MRYALISIGALVAVAAAYNYIQKRNAANLYYVKSLAKGYNARTLPPFGIFIAEQQKDNTALLAHEQIHWKQYQQLGLIKFYTHYLTQLKKFGYDAAPMEIAARVNETPYCQHNYTECVRTGKAVTANNPEFRK